MHGSYWNRILQRWPDRRLDEVTPTDIKQFVEHTKTHVVARRNNRGGRSAAEHLIPVVRCLYRHAEDDGYLTPPTTPHARSRGMWMTYCAAMEAGVHLPQVDILGEGLSSDRLLRVVARARGAGFVAVSANDHFRFARPWLDGLVALSLVAPHAGTLDLVTSVALPLLRGPLPLASSLVAVNHVAAGRVVAGVGVGSSQADYHLAGLRFEDRWGRFDAATRELKGFLQGESSLSRTELGGGPDSDIPVWVASWGSVAGLRRVARLGDGWMASAYNTDPARLSAGLRAIAEERARLGLVPVPVPATLVTMWTWVTESAAEADRVLSQIIAPMVGRSPEQLRGRLCVGPAQQCADLLSQYHEAGCGRVHFWPLGEEQRQLDLLAQKVLPQVGC